ncbi:hypothetical protein ABK040_013649 [Willaertia magna]
MNNKSIINNIGLFIIVGILFIYYCNGQQQQQQSIFNPSIANFQIEDNGLLFCKRNLNLTEIDYTSNIITNTLQCTSSQSQSSSSSTESKNNAFDYLSFYTLGDVGAVGLVGIHIVNISSSFTTTSNEDNNQLEEEEEEIAGILNFLQFNKFIIYQLQQEDSSNTLLTPILNKNNILKTIYLNESIDSNYSFKIINNQQQLNQQLNRVLYITNTYTTEIGNVTIYSIVSEVHVKSNYSNNNLFYIIPSSIVNFITIDNFNIMDNHLQNSNLQFILDISYYGLSTTNITQLSQSTSTTTKNEENNNDGDDIPYKESENRNVITIQSLDNNLPNSFISFTKQVIVSSDSTGTISTSSLPLQYNLFGISINGNNNNQSNNNEEENENNNNEDENILTFDDLPIPDDIDINLYKLYLFTSLNSLLTTTTTSGGGGNSNNIFIGPIHLGIKEEVKSNCKCSIVNSGDGENRDSNNNEQKNGDQQVSPQPSPQVSPQPTHSPIVSDGTRYPQESALQSPSPQTTITKVDDNNVQPSPSPQTTTVNTDSPVTSAGNRYPQESALNSHSIIL